VFAESPVFENPQAGGVTVSQADGSQVTFYPKSGSNCASPYTQATGGYCTLPLDVGASLTFSSGSNTYNNTTANMTAASSGNPEQAGGIGAGYRVVAGVRSPKK
jgi:hypothetical protein